MTSQEIIEKFCLTEDTTDPRWAGTPKHVWRGSRHGHGVLFANPTGDWGQYDRALDGQVWDRYNPDRPGWQYIEGWCDGPYRVVWIDFKQRAVFTYCEGDLVLAICDDDPTFQAELVDAERFYGPLVPESYVIGDVLVINNVADLMTVLKAKEGAHAC